MRMGGGFCTKARMPGTWASFGRSSSITSSAESERCARGLRRAKTRPELAVALGPLAPMVDM